jgi:hypothetical protein
MAEFQWWLLIVGLVAGGGLVALVFMNGARLEQEIDERERPAEATWISERLAAEGRDVDPYTAEAVLWAHKEYLALPPPDRIEVPGEPDLDAETDVEPWLPYEPSVTADPVVADEPAVTRVPTPISGDSDADRPSDEERDNGSGGPDRDLAPAGEQQAPPREEAHAGAHGEEAHER